MGGEEHESKTEEASPRRLEEALEKGNVPFSREIGNVASLVMIGLLLPIMTTYIANESIPQLAAFLDRPAEFRLNTGPDAGALVWVLGSLLMKSLWPFLLGLMLLGFLSSLTQHQPRFVLSRITPDFSRVSPSKGFKRIVGSRGRMEFLKSLVKIIIVCFASYLVLKGMSARILTIGQMSIDDLLRALVSELSFIFLAIGILTAGLAAADLVWSHFKWRSDLRMSRQELKDEMKQAEGDPIVRARQQSVARDRARRRMLASVPRATVVVANPTHFAVAMRYVHGETAVPMVLAKGVDHMALRIRELAEKNAIPVVEDKALARSLYEAVRTEQPIPPEFFRAIAEIILHLYSQQSAQLPVR